MCVWGISTKEPGHQGDSTLFRTLEKGVGSDQLDQACGYLYQRTFKMASFSVETLKETGIFHMNSDIMTGVII